MPNYRVVTDQKDADIVTAAPVSWNVKDGLLVLTNGDGELVGLWNLDHLMAVVRDADV